MILTYEKIRELKQLEKQDKLQSLPENFSTAVTEYIKLKKGSDEEVSANSLIKSLYSLRKKKIINMACLFYKTDKLPDNIKDLKDIERDFYVNMVDVIKKYHNSFDELFGNSSETGKELLKNENTNTYKNEIPSKQKDMELKENNLNLVDNKEEPKTKELKPQNINQETQNKSLSIKEEPEENFSKNKSQKDKLKVVFLLDIPEIVTPTGEICSFKEKEEKELDSEFAVQLKEQGFCRFK